MKFSVCKRCKHVFEPFIYEGKDSEYCEDCLEQILKNSESFGSIYFKFERNDE